MVATVATLDRPSPGAALDCTLPVWESLVRVAAATQYDAHCAIEHMFPRIARDKYAFSYEIVRQRDAAFASLRTWKVAQQAGERALSLPGIGAQVECLVRCAPAKHKHYFQRYCRDARFAEIWLKDRLSHALTDVHLSLLAKDEVDIGRDRSPFNAPVRVYRISGRIADPTNYRRLVLRGLGNLSAFGIGKLTPSDSLLYALLDAKYAS